MIVLRDYQTTLESDIFSEWNRGIQNVMAVAPTGSGKTTVFSSVIHRFNAPAIAIAHRHELVGQISLALARHGVRHRIIGQPALIRDCVASHMLDTGWSYYNANGHVGVASVDTLVKMPADTPWFSSVKLWVQDEAHHVLRDNKWGKAASLFPGARGLGVTATPVRADGKGLGRHADGLMDTMVFAPSMRDLINRGYLTDYRIFAPPSDLDLSGVGVSSGGDYSPDPLRKAVKKSHIIGDVVQHYVKHAAGKLGVTFCPDVESATDVAAAYRQAGIPAETVSAKTPATVRAAIIRRFASGEIKQLTNCDLFSEGFDLPAIEVVSMMRPTLSFGLYSQQFGRALRIIEGKSHALIIDHVQNVMRHGLPDAPQEWTLDRRERRTRSTPDDVIPVRVCPACTGVYERAMHGLTCPYCGIAATPATRSIPAVVDGDLYELDAETLARMRGEIDPQPSAHPSPLIQRSLNARHRERTEAQIELRSAMAEWAGRIDTRTDEATVRRLQREFFIKFGIDVMSAQAFSRADAESLTERIRG